MADSEVQRLKDLKAGKTVTAADMEQAAKDRMFRFGQL